MKTRFKPIFKLSTKLVAIVCLSIEAAGAASSSGEDSRWFRHPFDHFVDGAKNLGDGSSLLILGGGVAATLLSLRFDHSTRTYFDHKNRLGNADRVGSFLGNGIPSLLVASSSLALGLAFQSFKEQDVGVSHFEALGVTAGLVEVSKRSFQRSRPNGGSKSFPSGHSSIAFTTAGNLYESYGLALGIPALMLASFTAASRLSQNRHYLSDVVAGAALGFWVGRAFAHRNDRSDAHSSSRACQWQFLPYFESRNDFGALASISFR